MGAKPLQARRLYQSGRTSGAGHQLRRQAAPAVGQIVKFNNSTQRWEDEAGRNWNNAVKFSLPDRDVFAVNANTLAQTAVFAHVGTTLFNMVTNPVNGKLYVTNSEAINNVRFEGPEISAAARFKAIWLKCGSP